MSGRKAPEELQERTRRLLAKEGSKAVCNRTQVSAATILRVILGEPVSAGTVALLEKGLQKMDELIEIYKEQPIGIGFPCESPNVPLAIPTTPLDPTQAAVGFCRFVESMVRRYHTQKPIPWSVRPTGMLIGDESGIEILVGEEDDRITHDSAVTLELLSNPDDWKTDPNVERLARFVCREIERLRGDGSDGPPPKLRETREYEAPGAALERAKALAAEQLESLRNAEPASTLAAQPVESDRGAPGNSDGGGTRRVDEPEGSEPARTEGEPEHSDRREGDEPQATRNHRPRKRRG